MDIKDSYLHGTVGVVKSISVSADKLKYTLADIAGTVREVTLPVATQTANGLLSKEDKKKLDNMVATKVANDLILKINSGTTEGTSLYTYNGSVAKTLDIKNGTGIGFINNAGSLQIYNSGVRSIATGTTNGTISVNTNGTSANVAVKGLGSAAYTASTDYAVRKTLSNEDLNNVVTPGFYNAGGGNTVTNKPTGVEHFGMFVIHGAGGSYYVQILFEESYSNLQYRRHCLDGTWSAWTLDKLTDTTYSVVSSSANGLAPKVINTNTVTIGSAYYVLASTNGSATPSWYKLPATAFANDDTKVTLTNTTTNASYRVLLSGNNNDTTETTTARKSANLLFNPSTGNLTATSLKLNGNIIINDGTNNNRYIQWLYNNTDKYSWRIGYLGSGGANTNFLVFDSYREKQGWATALKFEHTTMIAHFGATVNAPTFQGNLDGTYVNKLTGYSKATSASALAATDTLNAALGKLEYKAHYAYDWVIGVTATDTDEYINKWGEIVGFLDSVKEGTDILDEFVTRKTNLTIIGLKNFNTDTNTKPLLISRGGLSTEVVAIGVNDSQAVFEYTNDEKANSYVFKMVNTDTEGSDGSGANTSQVTFTGNSAGSSVTATTFIGKLSNTLTFSAGAFTAKTYNNSLGVTVNIPTHTSHLTNNSGFLTQHLSLANYVTLNTTLTITGQKLFDNLLTIRKDVGSAEASVTDVQHYLQLQVMRKSDAHSVAIGVMPTGTGVIWAKALGIGYNTLYLNPYSNGVAIGCGDLKLPQLNDGYYFHIFGATLSNSTITATKFIKSGGTSSQFLKADGSVDSNTYLTSHQSLANYVTLNGALTISGVKTFSTQLKFTVSLGTSPFTVTSTTVVSNLNADYWDGKHWSDLIIGGRNYYKQYSGCAGLTKDPSIKGYTINSSNGINRIYNLGFDGYVGHWTVSFEIKASAACNVSVNLCDYTASSAYGDSSSTAVTTSYVKHTYVFLNVGKYHTSDSYNGFLDIENSLGYKIYVKNIKIEKGTKATDWSYAPEDLIHIGNYTDYTVKKDGTGATGTWGISITGSSASCTGNAATATKLKSTTAVSAKAFSLSNASWTDTGYTFASLASGTYAIQVTCGNLVASGIMSVYKNIDDTAMDEIPLHVYHDSTQPWRPYLRTSGKKLEISSNDASATSRTVTIKIALIL